MFHKRGGIDAMTEWARAHPSDFYRGIYARLLPTRTDVDARIDAPRTVYDMTDDELLAVIQRERAVEPESDAASFHAALTSGCAAHPCDGTEAHLREQEESKHE